jgi:hypothetical protein
MTPSQKLTTDVFLEDNPLYIRDAGRIRWARTQGDLRRKSIAWIGWIVVGLFGCSILFVVRDSSLLGWLMLGSIALDALLDLVCLVFTINTINGEIIAGRWDLLGLTSLTAEQIVYAKYAVGQLRAWRMMLIVTGVRFAVALLAVVSFVINILRWGWRENFVNTIQFILIFALFFAIYLIEPLWRLRAMTALGMAISVHTRSVVSSVLAGLFGTLAVWLSQGVIFAGIIFVFSLFARGTYQSESLACLLFLACGTVALAVYNYYRLLGRYCLRRVVRRVYQ